MAKQFFILKPKWKTVEKIIQFDNGRGCRLSGILNEPKGTSSRLVLLCHGLNSHKESTTNIALNKILSKHRLATFRFDFFGHGESEGALADRSVKEFVIDIEKAVKLLKTRGYKKFGICGASFGGVATVIAATKIRGIHAIALKAPGMGQSSRYLPNYKKDFATKSWIKAGTKIKIPTIIIHGTADDNVELRLGEELAEAIPSSKLEKIKGADHRFTKKKDFHKCVRVMADFLIAHLK